MCYVCVTVYGNVASQQLARCNWVGYMIVTDNCSDGKARHSRVCRCQPRACLHVCLRVLMGAISFDGTLPVCSWACVNICGWKGALLKSFLSLTVWAGFCMCLSVYWRICQEHLKVTKEARFKDTCASNTPVVLVLFNLPPVHLSFLEWQHANTLHLLITICKLSLHTWYYLWLPSAGNAGTVSANVRKWGGINL